MLTLLYACLYCKHSYKYLIKLADILVFPPGSRTIGRLVKGDFYAPQTPESFD
jgi:hypothetical protein